jgi:hypothetical protein
LRAQAVIIHIDERGTGVHRAHQGRRIHARQKQALNEANAGGPMKHNGRWLHECVVDVIAML